jgi:hypothetical protein
LVGRPTRRFHLLSALRPVGRRIDPEVALRMAAEGALVLDVRRHEDSPGPLEAALRISPDEIPGRIGEFSREIAIVLACT